MPSSSRPMTIFSTNADGAAFCILLQKKVVQLVKSFGLTPARTGNDVRTLTTGHMALSLLVTSDFFYRDSPLSSYKLKEVLRQHATHSSEAFEDHMRLGNHNWTEKRVNACTSGPDDME